MQHEASGLEELGLYERWLSDTLAEMERLKGADLRLAQAEAKADEARRAAEEQRQAAEEQRQAAEEQRQAAEEQRRMTEKSLRDIVQVRFDYRLSGPKLSTLPVAVLSELVTLAATSSLESVLARMKAVENN